MNHCRSLASSHDVGAAAKLDKGNPRWLNAESGFMTNSVPQCRIDYHTNQHGIRGLHYHILRARAGSTGKSHSSQVLLAHKHVNETVRHQSFWGIRYS